MQRKSNTRDIEPSVLARNPVIIANYPKHQNIWDQLSIGTLFTVARVACDLDWDLEDIETHYLERLIGRNTITMPMVAEVLRYARLGLRIEQGGCNRGPSKELEGVSAELDWEADQIVHGTGDMLGWQEGKNTRYGGKVQFSAVLTLDERITNTLKSYQKPLDLTDAVPTLDSPRLRGSSLFSRTFGSHHFLRLRLSDTIKRRVSVFNGTWDGRQRDRKVLQEWAVRPIFILGRVYAPLMEKDDVIVYFLEGPERIGTVFNSGNEDYGIPECTTVPQFIGWWIPLKHNGEKSFGKLSTRLELGLSDSLPGIFIKPEDIVEVDDIVNDNGVEFTDGAGIMSPSITVALHDKYRDTWESHSLYMAYQVRLYTAKGVLLVDPAKISKYDFEGPHQVKLHKSMCKSRRGITNFRVGPVNGMRILDAASHILCIVKPAPSSSPSGARLSSQFITVLSDCGVTPDLFLRIQEQSLQKELAGWTDITTEVYEDENSQRRAVRIDEKTRLRLARLVGIHRDLHSMIKRKELGGAAMALGYGGTRNVDNIDERGDDGNSFGPADEEDSGMMSFETAGSQFTAPGRLLTSPGPWTDNEISGLPALKAQQFRLALFSGIDIIRSNYWLKVLLDLVKGAMFEMVTKFHLPLGRSASGFLQPGLWPPLVGEHRTLIKFTDPTGILEEGQVCFTVKGTMIDSVTGLAIRSIEGDVIVGRHPACLPTDLRKVEAVALRPLEKYEGILFFSVKGTIPLASICAGGDYDGDVGMIIWDHEFVAQFQDADLSLRNPPAGFYERFKPENDQTVDLEKELKNLEEPEYSRRLAGSLMASLGEGQTFKIYNKYWNAAAYRDGLRGYVDIDKQFINTAATMGHTFNSLMDSKKTGLRIKKKILEMDKAEWSRFNEPYWSRHQKGNEKASGSMYNNKELKPTNGRTNILDQLIHSGEHFMNETLGQLKKRLRPEEPKDDFYLSRSWIDYDLETPYRQAKEWEVGNPDRETLLREIESSVESCWCDFKDLNRDAALSLSQSSQSTAKKPTTMAQRQARLRKISNEFAQFPQGSGDEVVDLISQGEWLRSVKASYAYIYDAKKSIGGSDGGFPWHVAMRELCMIKAKAIGGNTTTLPYSVVEKMEVHKDWA